MPKRVEDWITSSEAAAILTENSGHPVSGAYVRQLGIAGKINTKAIDGRTKLYWRRNVEAYVVRSKRGRKPKDKVEA